MSTAAHLASLIQERALACPRCKTADALDLILMAAGMHYGKVVCVACDSAFVTWAPKPTARPTPKDGRKKGLLDALRAHYDPEPLFCLICLVDERFMPTNTWMEAHHIVEYADAGSDHPSNLMPLCNECHAFVGWRRKTARGVGAQVGKEDKVAEHA